MEKIVNSDGVLCHIVYRREDIQTKRADIVNSEQFLQVAALRLNEGDTFKPHQHIWKHGMSKVVPQESWVVIQGCVEVDYYNFGDNPEKICSHVLYPGDISITLFGGHNYYAHSNNTLVYEYKTGPYTGQENDKEFI